MAGTGREIGKWVFALAVGLAVAFYAYTWTTVPPALPDRESEQAAVLAAREHLVRVAGLADPEIVDPLAPDRPVGKGYVYPAGDGWQVSGFYRRNPDDLWHPYLVDLDAGFGLVRLKLSDSGLLARDGEGGILEVLP